MKNNVCVNLKSYSKSEYFERKNHNLNRKNYNKDISYLLPKDRILEKLKEYKNLKKEYYEQNKEKRLEYNKEYREKKRDVLREYRRNYYKKIKEKESINKEE